MLIVAIMIGFAVGWLVNYAADLLPRYATEPVETRPVQASAMWDWLRGRQDRRWLRLQVAVEGGCALFAAFAWYQLGVNWLFYLIGVAFFVLVMVIDIKYRLVLNVLIYPVAGLVLVAQIALVPSSLRTVLVGGLFAFVIFFGSAYVRPGGLGGGDIKLATLIGLMFGFPGVLFALLLSAAASAVYIGGVLIARKGGLKSSLPYAPFLCFGALIMLLHYALEGGMLI